MVKMCDWPHNTAMPVGERTVDQLIDACEIKEEPDIKEEPQPVADLIEDDTDTHPPADYNQFGIHDNATTSADVQVKIEVKQESSQKNVKHLKSNNADNIAMGKQNGQQSAKCGSKNTNSNRNGKGLASKTMKSTEANTHVKQKEQHQCKQCEYATKYKHNLKRHMLKHTGEKRFPCNCCAKSFASKQGLENHMQFHVNEFLFCCSICFKGFNRKNGKLEHENDCNILRYECHLCKKSFGSDKRNLNIHMCVHNGEKPIECTECSKRFARKISLKRHLVIHAGPRSFRCSICRQRFSQEDEMIAHQQKCSRRTFECYICGKFIGCHKGNLEQHMRTHTGHKPFACTQCSKKFSKKSTIINHMKIHSRSLPWKCMICHQGFTKQSQWKAHQRNCTLRMYECHLCKLFFGSNNVNLKNHMKTHSGEKPF